MLLDLTKGGVYIAHDFWLGCKTPVSLDAFHILMSIPDDIYIYTDGSHDQFPPLHHGLS